jgi:hypothetical protein
MTILSLIGNHVLSIRMPVCNRYDSPCRLFAVQKLRLSEVRFRPAKSKGYALQKVRPKFPGRAAAVLFSPPERIGGDG